MCKLKSHLLPIPILILLSHNWALYIVGELFIALFCELSATLKVALEIFIVESTLIGSSISQKVTDAFDLGQNVV